jgi:hypothetical protein
MKLIRLHYAAVAAVAFAAIGAASSAQARDVYWSVGVHAAPGVTIGAGNYRPVYVAPAPVYYAPPPVYVAPAPVYYAPPPRVVYAPVVYHRGPVHHHHRGKGHGRHRGHYR